jgi:hypothetical protein
VLGNIVEVAIIVEQTDSVLDGNSSNHTVNRLPDRDAPFPKGSVKLLCTRECYLSHGQEDKIGKIVLCLDIVCVRLLCISRGETQRANVQGRAAGYLTMRTREHYANRPAFPCQRHPARDASLFYFRQILLSTCVIHY